MFSSQHYGRQVVCILHVFNKVEKYGKPNGVVGFTGVALAYRLFDEPATGNLSIGFPIARRRGLVGNITVSFHLQLSLSLQCVREKVVY